MSERLPATRGEFARVMCDESFLKTSPGGNFHLQTIGRELDPNGEPYTWAEQQRAMCKRVLEAVAANPVGAMARLTTNQRRFIARLLERPEAMDAARSVLEQVRSEGTPEQDAPVQTRARIAADRNEPVVLRRAEEEDGGGGTTGRSVVSAENLVSLAQLLAVGGAFFFAPEMVDEPDISPVLVGALSALGTELATRYGRRIARSMSSWLFDHANAHQARAALEPYTRGYFGREDTSKLRNLLVRYYMLDAAALAEYYAQSGSDLSGELARVVRDRHLSQPRKPIKEIVGDVLADFTFSGPPRARTTGVYVRGVRVHADDLARFPRLPTVFLRAGGARADRRSAESVDLNRMKRQFSERYFRPENDIASVDELTDLDQWWKESLAHAFSPENPNRVPDDALYDIFYHAQDYAKRNGLYSEMDCPWTRENVDVIDANVDPSVAKVLSCVMEAYGKRWERSIGGFSTLQSLYRRLSTLGSPTGVFL